MKYGSFTLSIFSRPFTDGSAESHISTETTLLPCGDCFIPAQAVYNDSVSCSLRFPCGTVSHTDGSVPSSLTRLLTPFILALQILPTCDPAVHAGGHHYALSPSTDVPRAGVGCLDGSCAP